MVHKYFGYTACGGGIEMWVRQASFQQLTHLRPGTALCSLGRGAPLALQKLVVLGGQTIPTYTQQHKNDKSRYLMKS